MSHLSTIIHRVKRRVEDNDLNAMFEQAIINLMEYIKAWDDYEDKEKKEAIELYDKYRFEASFDKMPSHKQRIKEADKIRGIIGS